MCGVFGIAGVGDASVGALEHSLRKMAQVLKHRGPDDEGFAISRKHSIGFGMTRLSIVDRSGGHQPIFNEDRTLAIVLNGEVYNHLELRAELEERGHKFRTKSDAEAVLHLFEEYGTDSIVRLNGIFAFAILNFQTGNLFFARDRFGVKPFFYSDGSKGPFAFASEAKAFAAVDALPISTSPQAVSDFFSYGYVPLPFSILAGVTQLEPGHWMIRSVNGELKSQRYWRPKYRQENAQQGPEVIEEYRRLFRNAIKRQLLGEVPIGAFLSGGLDSGSIVAALSSQGVQPLHTFSVGFDSPEFDETALLMQTAKKFATQHHHISFTGNDIANLVEEVTYAQDHPLGLTSYPYYLMTKMARQHVTVAMSGDGGDELLGGYDMYYGHRMLEFYRRIPGPLRLLFERGLVERLPNTLSKRGFDLKIRKFVEAAKHSPTRSYVAWRETFLPDEKQSLLLESREVRIDSYEPYRAYLEDESIMPIENRLMNADLSQFLVGTTLTIADRVGMANSLEVRVPFLDNDFFDFASGLDMSWKIRGTRTKVLLREAMKGILPGAVIRAPKLGFTPPLGQWFKGPLKPLMLDLLNDQGLRQRVNLNFNYAMAVYTEHLEGKRDHSRRLMALFSYLNWERVFKNKVNLIRSGRPTLPAGDERPRNLETL